MADDTSLRVIGIAGEAESGKDSIAKYLAARHGFTIIRMGDGPRAAFADLDGPDWDLRKDLDAYGLSNRWPLQVIGTECREDLPDEVARTAFWSHYVLVKILYLYHYHPKTRNRFAVSGIRYAHEPLVIGGAVRDLGGHFEVWGVERPGHEIGGPDSGHSSENSLHAVIPDRIILNNRSIPELLDMADSLI